MALSTKSADLTDGTPHVASKLYAAAWRAVKAMGYVRLITYILDREAGTSAHAAGWRLVGQAGGGSWHREGRPRVDKAPTCQKTLWEVTDDSATTRINVPDEPDALLALMNYPKQ